jgi:CheY-like chemotaxis protein/two-component sensor histidine kinase
VEHQLAHIVRLVDDLLDVSRIKRGKIQLKREPVDLVALVRGVILDYQPLLAESQLTLEASLPPEPIRMVADQVRLVQIVGNLLHNATKFTGPGGRVTLAVSVQAGGWGQVVVQDTGSGIPAPALAKIFEPFVQGQSGIGRAPAGLGLGLALVKGLVELHGGTVTAHSDGAGLGSVFTLRLPGVSLGERALPQAAAAGPDQELPGRRILIVEDHLDAATTLQLLLEMAGHTVAVAHDGETGLDLANRFAPDILLCDLGLPGRIDGYSVARAVRNTPGLDRVVLVAMTGFGTAAVKARSMEAGFHSHLTKPVAPEALVDMIRAAQFTCP